MEFIWGGDRSQKNSLLEFSLTLATPCDTLVLCAADFFRVLADGEFVSYGPERTAAGYAVKREISVKGVKELVIEVWAYNVQCYACDMQQPYFGAEVLSGGKTVYKSSDFACKRGFSHIEKMPRYAIQRGFVEGFDFTDGGSENIAPYAVESPVILGGIGDTASYERVGFEFRGESEFDGFDEFKPLLYQKNPTYQVFPDVTYTCEDFVERTKSGYKCADFELSRERSGFIGLKITAEKETRVYFAFEEILPGGKWIFRRSGCNDYIMAIVPAGETEFISREPYTFKYAKIIYEGNAKITPYLVALENAHADCVNVSGNAKFQKVFEAAKNTFKQNAVDIFTDCPGRERAGWLCDSYFTARSELLFTGKNDMEKRFLQNFLIARTEEIPPLMIPKCFPSQHMSKTYIPNWAMWFVIELYDCFLRTGDKKLVESAKDKVFGVVEFFEKYLDEFGLLEDLESWVFVEWSISNDKDYLKGVNFPSNMLYALMLETVGKLYGSGECKARADNIRKQIVKLSYDGKLFADNAVRENGVLTRCDDHVSETCQYYALFSGICPDAGFSERMKKEFGPLRKDGAYPEIGRSNMFIGNYLRFFWLCDIGEYERVVDECLDYFSVMADKTGTLWEKDAPTASCNHGFASVAAELLLRCAVGYKTVSDGSPVFDGNFGKNKNYGIDVAFDYDGRKITVKG